MAGPFSTTQIEWLLCGSFCGDIFETENRLNYEKVETCTSWKTPAGAVYQADASDSLPSRQGRLHSAIEPGSDCELPALNFRGTAMRLGRYFGVDAQFWLNLQTRYDLMMLDEKRAEID